MTSMKKVLDPAQPKPRSNNHYLINKFVTLEFSIDKGFWPREMKFAGQLLKKYGYDFLAWLPIPSGYKIPSLVWFLSPAGKSYMTEQSYEYQKQKGNLTLQKEEIPLTETKIGEDVELITKPKTLKDFLNYGKKIG